MSLMFRGYFVDIQGIVRYVCEDFGMYKFSDIFCYI